eukprot:SAG31_NODE_5002_length_2807_cov_33.203471_6_plen_73_part_00
MYNPAKPPFVTHFDGNRLIFDYIETFVCPTTTSASILGGQPFVFEGDTAATVSRSHPSLRRGMCLNWDGRWS